jgi:hypothetical protein
MKISNFLKPPIITLQLRQLATVMFCGFKVFAAVTVEWDAAISEGSVVRENELPSDGKNMLGKKWSN